MSLIWTMVGKDVRRLKWMAGLLLAVTVLKFGIGWGLMLGPARVFEVWKQWSQVVAWLVVAEVVLTWLVAGSLMMEDPLTGPQATWRTRPISLGRLLAAKVVGALLITAGPSLVLGLPWWWASGFGFDDTVKAAVFGIAGSAAVIAPSFFVAVLVDSMGRYVLWSIVGYAGMIMVPLATKAVADAGEIAAGWVLGAVATALAVGGWVVPLRDALQRRVLRGVAGGTAAVVAVVGWWLVTHGGLLTQPKWSEANPEQARAVKLTWRETTVVDSARRENGTTVSSWLAVEGVPQGLAVDVGVTEHGWVWTDGSTMTREGYGYPTGQRWVREAFRLPPEKVDAETAAWEEARQKEQEGKQKSASQLGRRPKGDVPTLLATAAVMPSVGAKLRSTTPSLVVKAQVRVVRPVEWLDVPLATGARAAGGGRGVRVTGVAEQLGTEAVVRIVDTRPLPGDFFDAYYLGRWRRPTYYGIDRETGRLTQFYGEGSPSVWIGGVEIQAQTFVVSAPRVIRGGEWKVPDARWWQRMRLVLLRWDEVARVSREARTEKFTVVP